MSEKLKWITQALAMSCEIQKSLFGGYGNIADELAIELESVLIELHYPDLKMPLTEDQKTAIDRLSNYLLSISGPKNIQYWDNEALCHCSEWENIRVLASDFLNEMGWEKIAPSSQDVRVFFVDD